MPESARAGEKIYRGIAVSPGVARGRILVLGKRATDAIPRRELSEAEAPIQLRRFEQALKETREEILGVQRQVTEGLGAKDASIFDAHLLVLEDPTLIEEVTRIISRDHVTAEYAFQEVAEKYARTLSAIHDEYLRERASDMRDVTSRLLDNLLDRDEDQDLSKLTEPCILFSYDLSPTQTARLNRKVVLGFATDIGGQTSHTAIMARSLRIPALVGLRDASQQLVTGQYALLDGFNGVVIVNPTDQTLFEYGQLIRKRVTLEEKLHDTIDKPAVTLDGTAIVLSANVESPNDTDAVTASGAEGVGLDRKSVV